MIEKDSDQYACTSPAYHDGRMYQIGDILLVQAGKPFKNRNFVLQKAAEAGDGKADTQKKKAKAPEVGG